MQEDTQKNENSKGRNASEKNVQKVSTPLGTFEVRLRVKGYKTELDKPKEV